MRKKKQLPSARKSSPKPTLPWQTGEYERHGYYHFVIPYQLLLLCRLMDITPKQLLIDFMDNLACGSWKRKGKDMAKEKLVDYFLEQHYGRQIYSREEISIMFREMDAIGLLYPEGAPSSLLEQHTHWRDNYHSYWFDKWFRKFNRET